VYCTRSLTEINFSKKIGSMDSLFQFSSESVQYCFILNVDSQTAHTCLFTFSDAVLSSRNAHYSILLIRTSHFNTFSYLSTAILNRLRRDNFDGTFSIRYTSPLLAGEITHKVWGFSLIMISTIHPEFKYIYSAVLA